MLMSKGTLGIFFSNKLVGTLVGFGIVLPLLPLISHARARYRTRALPAGLR